MREIDNVFAENYAGKLIIDSIQTQMELRANGPPQQQLQHQSQVSPIQQLQHSQIQQCDFYLHLKDFLKSCRPHMNDWDEK